MEIWSATRPNENIIIAEIINKTDISEIFNKNKSYMKYENPTKNKIMLIGSNTLSGLNSIVVLNNKIMTLNVSSTGWIVLFPAFLFLILIGIYFTL